MERNWGQYETVQTLFLQSRLKAGKARQNLLPQQHHPTCIIPWPSAVLQKFPIPRLKAETFQRNRFPKTGFLLTPPLGQQALHSCSASARMAQAPASHQWLTKLFSGDSYRNPWFPVPCFEADKRLEIQQKAASKPNKLKSLTKQRQGRGWWQAHSCIQHPQHPCSAWVWIF